MYYQIDTSLLQDETTLIQLGFEEEIEFFGGPKELEATASAWDQFPVDDPDAPEKKFNKYKFTSAHVSLNQDLR